MFFGLKHNNYWVYTYVISWKERLRSICWHKQQAWRVCNYCWVYSVKIYEHLYGKRETLHIKYYLLLETFMKFRKEIFHGMWRFSLLLGAIFVKICYAMWNYVTVLMLCGYCRYTLCVLEHNINEIIVFAWVFRNY